MDGPIGNRFWGKLERHGDSGSLRWHPLVDHCADVAACTEQLLRQRVIRQRLATLAGLADLDDQQQARLCVIAALHDLAKANQGFQRKALPAEQQQPVAGHVGEAIGLLMSRDELAIDLQHALGLPELRRWSEDPDTAQQWLFWSISHHGRPQERVHFDPKLWTPTAGRDPKSGLAALAASARRWFPLAFEPGGTLLPDSAELQHAFSGLVMLADWLGSNAEAGYFPYTQDEEAGSDRMPFARAQAARVLQETGIAADAARAVLGTNQRSFFELFGKPPRPAQAIMLDLPLTAGGSVTVLESETGSGKTEAALGRYVRMFQAGLVDGLYFALPTRTAATQIHRRVEEAVRRIFEGAPPPVTLAVPGYLRVDDLEGVRLSRFETLWPDSERERMRYRGWAAENAKRYLAGPIVVGTIDQVLFSALAVGHAHLRATALLRHLLVVDEIHASDAYMTRLLEEVLERHSQAGGHALLMSATLGSVARARYLGLRKPLSLAETQKEPYPLVSHRTAGAPLAVHPVAQTGRVKAVEVSSAPSIDAPEVIAARALEAARQGARVIVLRNTVKDCVATQLALESLAAAEPHLLFQCEQKPAPHHSRFSKDDRRKLDDAIECAFGIDSPNRGVVAVATQTIQQSLDLDADLMLTDLCPVDVLLQRLGRLHRHNRSRPAGFERPRAVILVPESRDLTRLITAQGAAYGAHGFGTVYDDLRILEATWRQLERHEVWRIPEMNRALVEATTHPEALQALEREDDRWRSHGGQSAGKQVARRQSASINTFNWGDRFSEVTGVFESNQKRSSRLGEDDRRVEFDPPATSAFGTVLKELSLPAWLVRDVPAEAGSTGLHQNADGSLRFKMGPSSWTYDRLGLRRMQGAVLENEEG